MSYGVLLINPQNPTTVVNREFYLPDNMLYLAATLLKKGIDVEILDLNVCRANDYKEVVAGQIEKQRPSLVGIGCLFSGQFSSVLSYAKVVKRHGNIPVVIGGIHPTNFPREILENCSDIDYIVIGEGEVTLVALADTLAKNDAVAFSQIDGLAYRNDGKVFLNPKTQYIKNLDEVPFPAYELINLKDYYCDTSKWNNPKELPINTSVPIISSRSCPFRCNFCSMYTVMGERWRGRSPSNVVDEIEFLYKTYNHRHFSFMDDNLTLKKSHALGICDEIVRRGLNIQFETPNGVAIGTLNKEVVDALVTAGLVRVSIAIESGSDYIREKIMGKPIAREEIYEIIAIMKQYPQLRIRGLFLIGMPEDTPETLDETYHLIQEIDIDRISVTNVVPLPHTRLFDQCVQDGLLVDELDPATLWKRDLFFGGNKQFYIKPYGMTLGELGEYREKFDALVERIAKRDNDRPTRTI